MSINRVILLGNVGADPDIRHTQNGDTVATFSLATSESWKDKDTGERKERTEWHRIVVFNQATAKVVEQYVKKGSKVGVEGMIKTRKYTDKDGIERYTTEIVIGNWDGRLSLEGSPQARAGEDDYGSTHTREPAGTSSTPKQSFTRDLDDEVPF